MEALREGSGGPKAVLAVENWEKSKNLAKNWQLTYGSTTRGDAAAQARGSDARRGGGARGEASPPRRARPPTVRSLLFEKIEWSAEVDNVLSR